MTQEKTPTILRWTNASTYCFERDCVCDGCIYNEKLETKCKMKDTVLALFSKFGKPEDKFQKIKKKQLFVADYYGYETQKLKLVRKIKELMYKIFAFEDVELFDLYADILNIINGLILYDDLEDQIRELQITRLEQEINLIHQKNFKERQKLTRKENI